MSSRERGVLSEDDRVTERPPDRFLSDDGHTGWFAFEPVSGASPQGHDEDPVIRLVRLRANEHAGPFWDDEGHLSDDYEELRRWIGVSRRLFDDVTAWNADFAATLTTQRDARWLARHRATQRALSARLRHEVHPGIRVPDAGD